MQKKGKQSRWKKTAELADTRIDESRRSSSMLIHRLQWLIVNDLLPESFSLSSQVKSNLSDKFLIFAKSFLLAFAFPPFFGSPDPRISSHAD